jgi:hypothetical protein
MDSFGEVIQTYSRPRTIWQCSISRTSPKERGPAIERPLRRLERHAETVVAMGYSPERTQILPVTLRRFLPLWACGTIVND